MDKYGHKMFDELMKDEENLYCFDCGKKPAQWASINNAIYLCLNCSGEHRGYGVNISFIRSVTMDTWNNDQIKIISIGGNRKLNQLLSIYKVDKKKLGDNLYKTKLLDFYRRLLKAEANGEKLPLTVSREDALKPCTGELDPATLEEMIPGKIDLSNTLNNIDYRQSYTSSSSNMKFTSTTSNSDRYGSVSSSGYTPERKDGDSDFDRFKSRYSSESSYEDDPTFYGNVSNFLSSAFGTAVAVKERVKELEIGSKMYNAGSAIISTGKDIIQSDVVRNISSSAANGIYNLYSYFFTKGSNSSEPGYKKNLNSVSSDDNIEYSKLDDNNSFTQSLKYDEGASNLNFNRGGNYSNNVESFNRNSESSSGSYNPNEIFGKGKNSR